VLDLLGEHLGELGGRADGPPVDRVGHGLDHERRVRGLGAHRVGRDHREVAALAGLLLGRVERPRLADEHEHLAAGLCDGVGDLGDGGVVVVAHDLATVDAALLVAPGDHRLDRVAGLVVQARGLREPGVVAVPDDDLSSVTPCSLPLEEASSPSSAGPHGESRSPKVTGPSSPLPLSSDAWPLSPPLPLPDAVGSSPRSEPHAATTTASTPNTASRRIHVILALPT
jgi:hypothetical protein